MPDAVVMVLELERAEADFETPPESPTPPPAGNGFRGGDARSPLPAGEGGGEGHPFFLTTGSSPGSGSAPRCTDDERLLGPGMTQPGRLAPKPQPSPPIENSAATPAAATTTRAPRTWASDRVDPRVALPARDAAPAPASRTLRRASRRRSRGSSRPAPAPEAAAERQLRALRPRSKSLTIRPPPGPSRARERRGADAPGDHRDARTARKVLTVNRLPGASSRTTEPSGIVRALVPADRLGNPPPRLRPRVGHRTGAAQVGPRPVGHVDHDERAGAIEEAATGSQLAEKAGKGSPASEGVARWSAFTRRRFWHACLSRRRDQLSGSRSGRSRLVASFRPLRHSQSSLPHLSGGARVVPASMAPAHRAVIGGFSTSTDSASHRWLLFQPCPSVEHVAYPNSTCCLRWTYAGDPVEKCRLCGGLSPPRRT